VCLVKPKPPNIAEGPNGKMPCMGCVMVANRNREIRLSGMKTGACGIVANGSLIEAQRETCWNSHLTLTAMRHTSIQTINR
jgi:hypothetical protein